MGARPYDPSLGRFFAVDPIDGGSLNSYDYAGQDPINAYDLAGTRCIKCFAKKVVKKIVRKVEENAKDAIGIQLIGPVLYESQKYGKLDATFCYSKSCVSASLHDSSIYVSAGCCGTHGPSVTWSPGGPQMGTHMMSGGCSNPTADFPGACFFFTKDSHGTVSFSVGMTSNGGWQIGAFHTTRVWKLP